MSEQDPREPVPPAPDAEYPPEEQALPESVPHMHHRLTDKQALALLGSYVLLRQVTTRVGVGKVAQWRNTIPWAVPLFNNSMIALIPLGMRVEVWSARFFAVLASSLFLSWVSGLLLYWAGYRFGPELAVRAEQEGSMWASIWNPKQVARAHEWIEKWGVLAVVIGRLVEWFTTPMLLVAGATRMSFRKFLPAYTAGAILFATAFLWLGDVAATRWPGLDKGVERLGPWSTRITLALLVLLIVAVLLARSQGPKQGAGSND